MEIRQRVGARRLGGFCHGLGDRALLTPGCRSAPRFPVYDEETRRRHAGNARKPAPTIQRLGSAVVVSSWRRHQAPVSLRPWGAVRAIGTSPDFRPVRANRWNRCGRRRRSRARTRHAPFTPVALPHRSGHGRRTWRRVHRRLATATPPCAGSCIRCLLALLLLGDETLKSKLKSRQARTPKKRPPHPPLYA